MEGHTDDISIERITGQDLENLEALTAWPR